jgi:hypothetical protein
LNTGIPLFYGFSIDPGSTDAQITGYFKDRNGGTAVRVNVFKVPASAPNAECKPYDFLGCQVVFTEQKPSGEIYATLSLMTSFT